VLDYAVRHGYADLVDTVDITYMLPRAMEAFELLNPRVYIAWVRQLSISPFIPIVC
jgi:hypothetical protein